MSLGWMVAAMNIEPGELRPAERIVLLAHADDARRGSRRSSPDLGRLMAVSGLGKSQVHEARAGLASRGLLKQVERARFGHVAVYEFGFDEDRMVYREEATDELRPDARTQYPPDGSGPPDSGKRDASAPPDPPDPVTGELSPAERTVASGPPDAPQGRKEIAGAAAGGAIDQRGRTPVTPDVARVIARIPGAGRSWAADVQTALDGGHLPGTVLDAVNAPLTDDVRNPTAVRRARLRDLATAPPDTAAFWASLGAEYPTAHPAPPPAAPRPPAAPVATEERSEQTTAMFARLKATLDQAERNIKR